MNTINNVQLNFIAAPAIILCTVVSAPLMYISARTLTGRIQSLISFFSIIIFLKLFLKISQKNTTKPK